MSNTRPTNREILERFESHVRSSQSTLLRMEEQLANVREDLDDVKRNQMTTGRVLTLIAVSISGTIATAATVIQILQ